MNALGLCGAGSGTGRTPTVGGGRSASADDAGNAGHAGDPGERAAPLSR